MANKIKSVKFNFIMNFILTLSSIIFPLITFPYVSRILLPSGIGRIGFVTSIVAYFSMFGMLGIANYGIRECARVRDDEEKLSKTVKEIFLLNTVAMTLSTACYVVAIFTVPRLATDKTLFLINTLTLIFTLLGVEWVYKALEQYQFITIRSLVFKVLSLILMFVFVKQESDVITYGTITVLAAVGSNLLNFLNLKRVVTFHKHSSLDIKRHIKPTLSFFFLTVATVIYTNLDVVMLGFIHGNEAVGYYNAAVKIKSVLVTLVTSLGAVLLPRLSFYIENNNTAEFTRLTAKSLNFIMLSALPMTIYFIFYAQPGILFLSGAGYDPAVFPMMILMPTLVFIGLSNLIGIQIMVPMGKEQLLVRSVCYGAITDLIVNILLVPSMGVVGSAIGNLAAEFVVVCYQWFAVRHTMKAVVDKNNVMKILASVVLSSLLFIVPIKFGSPFITLLLSASVYFGVFFGMLLLFKESFTHEVIGKLLKRKRGDNHEG
ncbi:flippase [Carnobacteriaceae bacterium zg-C25]|nr:flippase [Carnobacteriaceae bacterium zg-C25]